MWIRYIKYGRIFELYLSIGIIISLILSFLFNIKVNNLISFYSMILPFVFALIIGIKSLMFIVNKDDFKDEKTIKNNLNEIAEDIFKRLFFFFVISLIIFFILVLTIDTENVLIKNISQNEFVQQNIKIIDWLSNQVTEIIIFLSFFYFVLILVDIFTIMRETINLNNLKNKINKRS